MFVGETKVKLIEIEFVIFLMRIKWNEISQDESSEQTGK